MDYSWNLKLEIHLLLQQSLSPPMLKGSDLVVLKLLEEMSRWHIPVYLSCMVDWYNRQNYYQRCIVSAGDPERQNGNHIKSWIPMLVKRQGKPPISWWFLQPIGKFGWCFIWLVVEPPLWKIWIRQSRLLFSKIIYIWKNKNCSQPPIRLDSIIPQLIINQLSFTNDIPLLT